MKGKLMSNYNHRKSEDIVTMTRDQTITALENFLLDLHISQYGRTFNITRPDTRTACAEWLADGPVRAVLNGYSDDQTALL